jgi:hypothetical protein
MGADLVRWGCCIFLMHVCLDRLILGKRTVGLAYREIMVGCSDRGGLRKDVGLRLRDRHRRLGEGA